VNRRRDLLKGSGVQESVAACDTDCCRHAPVYDSSVKPKLASISRNKRSRCSSGVRWVLFKGLSRKYLLASRLIILSLSCSVACFKFLSP
jgi:hypothetical protein